MSALHVFGRADPCVKQIFGLNFFMTALSNSLGDLWLLTYKMLLCYFYDVIKCCFFSCVITCYIAFL